MINLSTCNRGRILISSYYQRGHVSCVFGLLSYPIICNQNFVLRSNLPIDAVVITYSYFSSSSSTTDRDDQDNTVKNGTTTKSPIHDSNISSPITIPEPTWSVNSLQLHKNHKPMDYNELKVLAKRAVIDLDYLSNSNKMNIQHLCQDLGNMMHMIQNVTTMKEILDNNTLTCQDIYDRPRGVTMAPLRTGNATENIKKNPNPDTTVKIKASHVENTNETYNKDDDASDIRKENIKLWDHYIKPTKMKSVGGHHYFVIPTKIENK